MSDSSALPKTCPQCGTALPADATDGLCPRCLIALNLATETNLEEFGPDGTKAYGTILPNGKPVNDADVLEWIKNGGEFIFWTPQEMDQMRKTLGTVGEVVTAKTPELKAFYELVKGYSNKIQ